MVNEGVVDGDDALGAVAGGGLLLQEVEAAAVELVHAQSASVRKRLRHDWSVVWANSRLMPQTVLRSATNRPVRYSAKWRRWGSLGSSSPKCWRASWTTVGKSMMPAMAASQGKDEGTQGSVQRESRLAAPSNLCKRPVITVGGKDHGRRTDLYHCRFCSGSSIVCH